MRKAPSKARIRRVQRGVQNNLIRRPSVPDAADSNAPRIPPSPLWMLGGWRVELLRSFEKSSWNHNFGPPRRSKIELCRGLGGMFESFGVPGGVLVLAGRAWNAFRVCLRVSGVRLRGVLGPSWRVLGGSWKGFSESWRLPGSFLAIFLEFVWPS